MCYEAHFVYIVKNAGSGNFGPFTVKDDLAERLETESGKQELVFEVDGLKAGEERKFEVDIRPLKRGEVSSRAVATAKDSDLKNQSANVTTTVKGPELAVKIDGPEVAPANEQIEYTVQITNRGNQEVDQGKLEITLPPTAELEDRDEPTARERLTGESTREENGQRRAIEFSGLQAGDTMEVKFNLTGTEEANVKVTAKASYVCKTSDGEEALAVSEAKTSTKIVALPALLVAVVDAKDPIQVGKEVAYKITVINQGNSADSNLKLTAELPENLVFERVSGETSAETSAEAEDGKVAFDTVQEIKAGDKLEWTLYARANGDGEAWITVKVDSEGLEEPVESQEPTRLFGGEE